MLLKPLIGLVLVIALLPGRAAESAVVSGRLPLPSAEAIQEARSQVRIVFKDEFAKPLPADKLLLLQKLLKQAGDAHAPPAERIAELREGAELALAFYDVKNALDAIHLTCSIFETSAACEAQALLQKLLAGTTPKAVLANGAEVADAVLRETESAADFDSVPLLSKLLEQAAQHSGNSAEIVFAREQLAASYALVKSWQALKPSLAQVERTPGDPAANLALGRFLFFSCGAFDKALPMLAQGSDQKLKNLAAAEVAGAGSAAAQAALGDAWWDYAEKEPKANSRAFERAKYWYVKALPELAGLQKNRIEKRLETHAVQARPSSGVYRVVNPQWISRDATYAPNTIFGGNPPLPYFLSLTGTVHSVTPADKFAVCTDDSADPYLVIDLGMQHFISGFEIENRTGKTMLSRAKNLTVWVAKYADGPWLEVWQAGEVKAVWKVPLEQPVLGRYVKVGLPAKGFLHLLSMKVLGE